MSGTRAGRPGAGLAGTALRTCHQAADLPPRQAPDPTPRRPSAPTPRSLALPQDGTLRAALAAATDDRIVYDLDGIEAQYAALLRELPGVGVRFALKACPVDEVLACLAQLGAGCDAASPHEIEQALRAGVPVGLIHYGNTVKSDRNIAEAYRLGVRDFATDSLADVTAIAVHAPGSRVFCRLATSGEGALWGLSRKFGCSPEDAVLVLEAARAAGLTPAGLSVHVGSQQMTSEAWQSALDLLAGVVGTLNGRGILLDHVNLGGGLPALGVLDKRGRPLDPPVDKMFAMIREGVQRLREVSASPLDFLLEPGRHLVADHGAIRAHVSRLTARRQPSGELRHWLYLSCGKFNGLYEMDELQYRLEFPTHTAALPSATPGTPAATVPAVVAGPTCDSDDAYAHEDGLVRVPAAAESGDPVWVFSCGAYATAYMTQGFNGFQPLPYTCVRAGAASPEVPPR
ncbi:type III PLP-dependent enzyme [Kitasatospora sp. CM 4170]|uniref:ornithine decarboxylase n=1 Tax=Kitasatospora aburaviensis TaxID=67265 RepID=A0ABW1ETB2_9ACTN|nr:type III PLP-dependent enzyme [Kitasatospora sp. CM 4170]WNM44850.1 type III PLP-dependent enzyme [Kitasatospora sp. CM 4170]